VGETRGADGLAPELESEVVRKVGSGGPGFGLSGSPFWRRESTRRAVDAKGTGAGEQQDGVGCDSEGWCGGGAGRCTDLGLVESDDLFFISEVDFDVPPADIGSEDLLGIKVRVGTDQEGWLPVEDFGASRESVFQGSDGEETQVPMRSGGSPQHGGHALVLHCVDLASRVDLSGLPLDGRVESELFWRHGFLAVKPSPADGAVLSGLR